MARQCYVITADVHGNELQRAFPGLVEALAFGDELKPKAASWKIEHATPLGFQNIKEWWRPSDDPLPEPPLIVQMDQDEYDEYREFQEWKRQRASRSPSPVSGAIAPPSVDQAREMRVPPGQGYIIAPE